MKNLLYISSTFIAVSLFLILSTSNAHAEETAVNLDQSHLPSTGNAVTISTYGWGQTFTPGLNNLSNPNINRLSSVHINTKDEVAGDTITITVIDNVTGQYVVNNVSHRMGGDVNWESFYFYPKKNMIAGHEHQLLVTTTNPTTKWIWNTAPGYAGGERQQNGHPFSGDFAFMTWGSTYSEPEPEPVPEVVPDIDDGNDQGTQEDTQTEDQTAGSSEQITPAVLEVGADVVAPTLDYIEVNDDEHDAPIKGTMTFTEGDEITVYGTAKADSTILIFINDYAYSVESDSNGNWSFVLSLADLPIGEYSFMAQTKVDDVTGSEKMKLFDFTYSEELLENNTDSQTSKEDNANDDLVRSVAMITIVCLSVLLIFLIILAIAMRSERVRNSGIYKEVKADFDKLAAKINGIFK